MRQTACRLACIRKYSSQSFCIASELYNQPSEQNSSHSQLPKSRQNETSSVLKVSSLQHWFKNWQEERKHKLTASTFAGAIVFFSKRRVQLWLEKIGAIELFSGNLATCWSNIKEEEALVKYKLITGNDVSFPKFQVYRETNSVDDDWLGASPDGVIDFDRVVYELPARGVSEIKCPLFNDMGRAAPWKKIPVYYIPQAQGLMEILDRDWMDLYVWTPKGSSLFRLQRDVEYWDVMKTALSDFWWKHIQPTICHKSVITNPFTQLRQFKAARRHEFCGYIVAESKRIVDSSDLVFQEINGNFYTLRIVFVPEVL